MPTPFAKYQAIGAASYAASLVNLANPGTFDLSDDTVSYIVAVPQSTPPGWNAVDGWIYTNDPNDPHVTAQCLSTGISDTDLGEGTGSVLVRFSDLDTNTSGAALFGGSKYTSSPSYSFMIALYYGGSSVMKGYNWKTKFPDSGVASAFSGVAGINGQRLMIGASHTAITGANEYGSNNIDNIYIGALWTDFPPTYDPYSTFGFVGKIQAISFYAEELTDQEMDDEAAAMMALTGGNVPASAALNLPTAKFKVINAGYMLTEAPKCRCVSEWNRHKMQGLVSCGRG